MKSPFSRNLQVSKYPGKRLYIKDGCSHCVIRVEMEMIIFEREGDSKVTS